MAGMAQDAPQNAPIVEALNGSGSCQTLAVGHEAWPYQTPPMGEGVRITLGLVHYCMGETIPRSRCFLHLLSLATNKPPRSPSPCSGLGWILTSTLDALPSPYSRAGSEILPSLFLPKKGGFYKKPKGTAPKGDSCWGFYFQDPSGCSTRYFPPEPGPAQHLRSFRRASTAAF